VREERDRDRKRENERDREREIQEIYEKSYDFSEHLAVEIEKRVYKLSEHPVTR
jgi:hypothetical protein